MTRLTRRDFIKATAGFLAVAYFGPKLEIVSRVITPPPIPSQVISNGAWAEILMREITRQGKRVNMVVRGAPGWRVGDTIHLGTPAPRPDEKILNSQHRAVQILMENNEALKHENIFRAYTEKVASAFIRAYKPSKMWRYKGWLEREKTLYVSELRIYDDPNYVSSFAFGHLFMFSGVFFYDNGVRP